MDRVETPPRPRSEGKTFPNGTLHILKRPISTLGETAEIAELLRLFVIDRVSEEALTTHTARTPREEQMAQSSKRVREEDDDADLRGEEMAESASALHQAHAPPVTPTIDGPLPLAADQPTADVVIPPESTTVQEELFSHSGVPTTEPDTPTLTELQLRAAAWEAFRVQPLLPTLVEMDLKHVSALVALLLDGEWGADSHWAHRQTQVPKTGNGDMASMGTIPLKTPLSPMGPIQVQEATIKVLIAHYKHGPAAIEAVKDIKDYAEASLTLSAFVENTNITLEEDPVHVTPTAAPLGITSPRAIRPSSSPLLPQE